MMEFVPVLINGGVVLNAVNVCSYVGSDCKSCPDMAVGIHNWLISNNFKYLLVDFQDEKDVCQTMLIELLQLRKRLRFPFLLIGLMERPMQFLKSYAYSGYPFFTTPEDAVNYMYAHHPALLETDLSGVEFHKPIPCGKYRSNKGEHEGDEDDYEDEASGDL
jgi:hypothetical protein